MSKPTSFEPGLGEGPGTQEVDNYMHPNNAPDEFWVEVVRGPDTGCKKRIQPPLFRIGVDPLCDLVLSDPTCSRRHCEIAVTSEGFRLHDLGSTNGTFVDELRLGEIYLDNGARIQVGNTLLAFTLVRAGVRLPLVTTTTSTRRRIIGHSPAIERIFEQIGKVGPTDLSVVIEGETGTGKELVASAIHAASRRADKRFVVFDCSAFAPTLIESELFGHMRGAFSGAIEMRKGVFERADGGTIFFDEFGEMDVGFQAKFLRVLESGEVRRVGGENTFNVDVRVIVATNRNLESMIAEGTFRQDLFYRIAKVKMVLPPLRDRTEDIPLLVSFLLSQALPGDASVPTVTDAGIDVLCAYPWPGNVRELRNIVERAVALCEGGRITGDFLRRELRLEGSLIGGAAGVDRTAPLPGVDTTESTGTHDHLLPDPNESTISLRDAKEQIVADFEKRYLVRLLEKHKQNVSQAAREGQVDRRHFYRLLKKYNLMD